MGERRQHGGGTGRHGNQRQLHLGKERQRAFAANQQIHEVPPGRQRGGNAVPRRFLPHALVHQLRQRHPTSDLLKRAHEPLYRR